jgi:iron complex outermembrane recepter protein
MGVRLQPIHLSLPALLGLAGIAAAQTVGVATASGTGANTAPSTDGGEIAETIVVTSQRRIQTAQDVPIAEQVVTSQQIRSLTATDLATMNGYIPGLNIDGSQATQPIYTLRGIRSGSDFGVGTDSPVGIYEDGVYTGKTGGALLLFNDVQRVEVLKGPQGTLFGRNSAAGAISVVTNEPTSEWAADAKARFGDYGTRHYEAMVNAPLGEDVAARATFVDNHSDGWLQDSAMGQRYERDGDWGLRAQLRWNAPSDTQVRLIWEHEQLSQPARPAIGIAPLPPPPGVPPVPSDPSTWISPFAAPVVNDAVDPVEKRSFDGITLRAEHEFSFANCTSISAYRHFNTVNREDGDGTNRLNLYLEDNNYEQNRSFSQELTLAHKDSLADWVAGASYYYDDAHQTSQLDLFTNSIDTILNATGQAPGGLYGPLSQLPATNGIPLTLLGDPWQENMINRGISRAYALFGDAIWHVAPRWNLTTGVRFTHDEKAFSWYNPARTAPQLGATLAQLQQGGVFDIPGVPPIQTFQQNLEFNTPISTGAPLVVSNRWNDTSPRVVLDYKPAPALMFYLSVARGYQAGGYNIEIPGAKYGPETVRNYELGVKSELFDARLLLNASAYYYSFSNLQNLLLVSNGNGALPAYEMNVSDQRAKGLDVESHWHVTEGLRLNLLAAYIDATYKDGVALDGANLTGQPTGEPLWTVAGGFEFLWRNMASGDVDFILQDAYRGAGRCNADSQSQGSCIPIATFRTDVAQNRTDAHLSWTERARVPLSVAMYANNLFDKRYASPVNLTSATTLGTPFTDISPPRFWGIEVGVHF